MRNKLLLLFILVVLFLIFIIIRFFVFDKTHLYGRLKISSSPSSSVFINNVIVGKTPFEDKFAEGEYLVKLIPEGQATETASWSGKVKVLRNTLSYINRELGTSDITSSGEILTVEKIKRQQKNKKFGEIYIETEPQGAIVSLDNEEKGVSPLLLQNVLEGQHELTFSIPGYFRRNVKLKVDAGYRINVFVKLALDKDKKSLTDLEKETTTSSSLTNKTYVIVNNNPLGWLRVRMDPSLTSTEAAKIKVGEKFEFLEEKNGWYKIRFNNNKESLVEGSFTEGWVSKEYVSKE